MEKKLTIPYLYLIAIILLIPWLITPILILHNPETIFGIIYNLISITLIPIGTYLTVHYFNHSSNQKRYIIEMGIIAVLTEIPVNILLTHSVLPTIHSPIFAIVLVLVIKYTVEQATRDMNKMSKFNFITVFALLIATALSLALNIYQATLICLYAIAFIATESHKKYTPYAAIAMITVFCLILFFQSQVINYSYFASLLGLLPICLCDDTPQYLPGEEKHPKIRYLYKSAFVILPIIASIILIFV